MLTKVLPFSASLWGKCDKVEEKKKARIFLYDYILSGFFQYYEEISTVTASFIVNLLLHYVFDAFSKFRLVLLFFFF